MAVYVDDMKASFRGMMMCHMIADSHYDLMVMAGKIGVDHRHIQNIGTVKEHFDICQTKRKLAIEHGCIEITQRQAGRIIAKKIVDASADAVVEK